MPLSADDLETVWGDLAEAIDAVAPERRELFLCKLVLALARSSDDARAVREAFDIARRSLEPPR